VRHLRRCCECKCECMSMDIRCIVLVEFVRYDLQALFARHLARIEFVPTLNSLRSLHLWRNESLGFTAFVFGMVSFSLLRLRIRAASVRIASILYSRSVPPLSYIPGACRILSGVSKSLHRRFISLYVCFILLLYVSLCMCAIGRMPCRTVLPCS